MSATDKSSIKQSEIPILNPFKKDEIPELIMIETQGEIEHTSKDSKNFNNMKLGTLLKTPGAKTYELL